MARAKDDITLWGSMASTGLYKRTQGRMVRQMTALALGVLVLLGCWTMTVTLFASAPDGWEENWATIRYGVPIAVGIIGLWAVFRVVNYPRFADFLIAVEAEMDKVSWPDQTYLIRATGVVLSTMLILVVYLLVCDLVWTFVFQSIGFLRT